MTPEEAVLYSIGICAAGAVVTLLLSMSKSLSGWLSFLTMVASGVLIVPRAVQVLASGPANPHHPQPLWEFGGYMLRFYVDGLSAIFLLLAVLIGVAAALYSIVHVEKFPTKSAALYHPFLLLFVGGMYGILSITDTMWFFCAFWQLMTIPSFILMLFESEKPGIKGAAFTYLFFMEAAMVAAMAGAFMIAGGHAEPGLKYDFDTLAEGIPALISTNPQALTGCLALFLLGFGIKVGMWPFGQLWVPDAYAAAPSPVTALISGVMSKTGVYGLMRTFLWLVPADVLVQYDMTRWGMGLAILGTITLFTGTMQGLKQDDTKRLLAFSSVGQIGYIILALGACVALIPSGDDRLLALAAIAFCGGLLHAINHGIFKGLLFFSAGSLYQATGSQDLNKMGGLWKYMPVTGFTVLIASFGIAGVPLLNGFVSKWSIYVATVQGSTGAKYLAVCAIIAILTSAMTLAMYIKFFGVAFLSRQSTLVKQQAAKQGRLEVGLTQQLPQLVMAILCIVIGLAPGAVYQVLDRVLSTSSQGCAGKLAEASANSMSAGITSGLSAIGGDALYVPVVLAIVLAIAFAFVYIFSKQGGSTRRSGEAWLCGYAREEDCFRYGASNFYGEIKRCFGWLGGNPRPRTRIKED
jgi:formate hydrogenlyase subunit 3/multisubunit Na+/H+ antiporter MnhD subunit